MNRTGTDTGPGCMYYTVTGGREYSRFEIPFFLSSVAAILPFRFSVQVGKKDNKNQHFNYISTDLLCYSFPAGLQNNAREEDSVN